MLLTRSRTALTLLSLAIGLVALSGARAADVDGDILSPTPAARPSYFLPFPTPEAQANSVELRVGAFAHSVGASEAGGVDANVEVLLPRFPVPAFLPPEYAFLVPRPQLGAMINTGGKTSYGYAGVVWTVNITPQFFLEPMFGGTIHNGDLNTFSPTQNELGCRVIFHTGLSGGYRITEHWTALLTWDHISNAHLCPHNNGMNDYGLKLGYTF
jgi:lipid A 3-O-deacylase